MSHEYICYIDDEDDDEKTLYSYGSADIFIYNKNRLGITTTFPYLKINRKSINNRSKSFSLLQKIKCLWYFYLFIG